MELITDRRSEPDVQVLFAEHYLHLVRLAASLVDGQEAAEDVVQDVFAALQRNRRADLTRPEHYLVRAVVNRSRSVLRRRRVVRSVVVPPQRTDAEPADAEIVKRAENDRIRTAIRRLPQRQREVVVLRYFEDLEIAEIAQLLGIKPTAVSASLHRAVSSLRGVLDGSVE
ncbi:RNA polymerase sigma factor [Lentzea tibetensis]|nr:sigma-70 family RNA polymerase sigma factor [Lentzea tibetensis]